MICLDTSPVIWGVQSTANKSQTELISRMGAYLRYLKETRIPIMVPSPVVFEYLVPFNKEEKPIQIELIERLFIVPSFDLAAAAIAAELTGSGPKTPEFGSLCEEKASDQERLAL